MLCRNVRPEALDFRNMIMKRYTEHVEARCGHVRIADECHAGCFRERRSPSPGERTEVEPRPSDALTSWQTCSQGAGEAVCSEPLPQEGATQCLGPDLRCSRQATQCSVTGRVNTFFHMPVEEVKMDRDWKDMKAIFGNVFLY